MNVLDTDLLVAILRKMPEARNALNLLDRKDNSVTSITSLELWYGAFKSEKPENAALLSNLLSQFPVLEFDQESSKIAAAIWRTLEKQGAPLDIRDVLTSGICIKNDAILYTRNINHFKRVEGLKVKQW
ncbi:type II toxin-antitoxin system VapC family toxin [Candidatus Micrarchaeota archaeon]|nr:type II toxin-antitoxin system VapC family toxin [Candidatus Micrarchaeota archaeon]